MTHSSLLISALAHIGLIILAAVGLPALHDPPDPVEVPIPVTVTMVSERTEAKGPLPPVEPSPPEAPAEPPEPEPVAAEPPPVEAPPPEPEPREEPVQVAALEPEPPRPEPPPEPEPAPAVAPLPPSPPEPEKAPSAPDPKPPPLPQRPPPQQARAKPAPKPPEPQPAPPPLPQAAPQDPPDELAALRQAALSNDLDTLRSAVSDKSPPPREEAEEAVFTESHSQRLKRQLKSCWQPIRGLDPSEDYTVKLKVTLGPDRRVISTKPVDVRNSRSYQAGREWAERALRHPLCERLDVPTGWTSLTLNFDPRQMQ